MCRRLVLTAPGVIVEKPFGHDLQSVGFPGFFVTKNGNGRDLKMTCQSDHLGTEA